MKMKSDKLYKNLVNIVVILCYIFASLLIFLGTFLMIGSIIGTKLLMQIISSSYAEFLYLSSYTGYLSLVIFLISVMVSALGIFLFFVTRAVSEYKEWGRLSLISLCVLEFAGSLFLLPLGFIPMLIDILLIYMFGVNKRIKGLYEK